MSRSKSYRLSELTRRAMELFWRRGYHAASVRDLVAATGVSRHGLYQEFGDKRGAFLAAMERYGHEVVDPAFCAVERDGAGIAEIRAFFERQIAGAEAAGLPGPGCLYANTMAEAAPLEAAFLEIVRAHLERQTAGFARAIRSAQRDGAVGPTLDADAYAEMLVIAAQGLWTVSRALTDAAGLRRSVDLLLAPLEKEQGT